jgi:hypothetical protein
MYFRLDILLMSEEEPDTEIRYEPCSICSENPDTYNAFLTPCNHTFHKTCLKTWLDTCMSSGRTQTCPLCRRELNDVLNEMSDRDRDVYLNYADTLGIRIQFERQKILLASNIIEALIQGPIHQFTGVDISGSTRFLEHSIDNSLNHGDDLFGMNPDANRGKSIIAILSIVAISIFGAIFANRTTSTES